MHTLFVHGMGRTPLSAWRMLRALRSQKHSVETLYYSVTFEQFDCIVTRLHKRFERLAKLAAPYAIIGHSLGGVLIRAALRSGFYSCPPQHVIMLGSPIRAVGLAKQLQANVAYRLATGDCGQLLASDDRMNSIPRLVVPCTAIIGTRGYWFTKRFFDGAANDGVVAVDEVRADWFSQIHEVPVVHTLLPSSAAVCEIVLRTLAAN